jgi:exonuclease III
MSLRVCAVNVRGLRSAEHRQAVLARLRELRGDVFLLSETHDIDSETKQAIVFALGSREWDARWHGECGVLWRRRVTDGPAQVVHVCAAGRALVVRLPVRELGPMLFAAVYGFLSDRPEPDRARVWRSLPWERLASERAVLGGDWNCLLRADDKVGGAPVGAPPSVLSLSALLGRHDLTDAWLFGNGARATNGQGREFTWRHNNGEIFERLDRVYLSGSLTRVCDWAASHVDWTGSDHAVVCLELSPVVMLRGPGLWKANASVVANPETQRQIERWHDENMADAPDPVLDPTGLHEWYERRRLELRDILRELARSAASQRLAREQAALAELGASERFLLTHPGDVDALDRCAEAKRGIMGFTVHRVLYKPLYPFAHAKDTVGN